MNFEVINKEGDLLTTFELESNPFKVNEVLYLTINNNDPNFWYEINNMSNIFTIVKIEHSLRQFYNPQEKYNRIFTVSITVE